MFVVGAVVAIDDVSTDVVDAIAISIDDVSTRVPLASQPLQLSSKWIHPTTTCGLV